MSGDKTITVSFRAAFVNGPTDRPVRLRLGAVVGITAALDSSELVTSEFREAKRIGTSTYQLEVPMVPQLDYNALYAVVGGVVDECTAPGTKRLLVNNIRHQSSDGWAGAREGTFLFIFECGPELPEYTNVANANLSPTVGLAPLELPFATQGGTRIIRVR